ncbi:hypothetical protein IDJ77_11545 [Mucilaginibacter sp. ZT4R22]|uniref:Immunity protein 63 of polymorphic toxin system n=1 Tax=Mucilaginibacter pankratovii TaxID=2772110 RepID=A0ABR7WQK4_9SPHI|nr:hypothetical protein [Mucilaginibacter pankratovii]MBD1364443.1 hypothetical protein [Mucilaginibacter pankratovii]
MSKKSFIKKRWKAISNSTHPNNYQALVEAQISFYEEVTRKVVELYIKPGSAYFFGNYKDDGSEPFKIYSFISPTFMWCIECTLDFQMVLEYEFNNCPYEQQIWLLFEEFHLTQFVTRKERDLAAYFKGVVAYQDPKYIITKS